MNFIDHEYNKDIKYTLKKDRKGLIKIISTQEIRDEYFNPPEPLKTQLSSLAIELKK